MRMLKLTVDPDADADRLDDISSMLSRAVHVDTHTVPHGTFVEKRLVIYAFFADDTEDGNAQAPGKSLLDNGRTHDHAGGDIGGGGGTASGAEGGSADREAERGNSGETGNGVRGNAPAKARDRQKPPGYRDGSEGNDCSWCEQSSSDLSEFRSGGKPRLLCRCVKKKGDGTPIVVSKRKVCDLFDKSAMQKLSGFTEKD